jgi:hypothetical protein
MVVSLSARSPLECLHREEGVEKCRIIVIQRVSVLHMILQLVKQEENNVSGLKETEQLRKSVKTRR